MNAKTFMIAAYTKNDAYPDTIPDLEAAGFTPGTVGASDYVVEFELFNVTADGFCLRAWADTDTTRDLWVTQSSPVVGPIPVSDTAGRPDGCPGT